MWETMCCFSLPPSVSLSLSVSLSFSVSLFLSLSLSLSLSLPHCFNARLSGRPNTNDTRSTFTFLHSMGKEKRTLY